MTEEPKKESDDTDLELKRIRMQRIQEIMRQKQEAEVRAKQRVPTIQDKVEMLLRVLMQPAAFQYLNEIRTRNINLYNQIKSSLFPPEIIAEIDVLMEYYHQGLIRIGIISLDEVQLLERQILGISSSITVKKQGEKATSLSSFLKDS